MNIENFLKNVSDIGDLRILEYYNKISSDEWEEARAVIGSFLDGGMIMDTEKLRVSAGMLLTHNCLLEQILISKLAKESECS